MMKLKKTLLRKPNVWLRWLCMCLLLPFTFSYYARLHYYTIQPIEKIAANAEDPAALKDLLAVFKIKKRKDLRFVRIAVSSKACHREGCANICRALCRASQPYPSFRGHQWTAAFGLLTYFGSGACHLLSSPYLARQLIKCWTGFRAEAIPRLLRSSLTRFSEYWFNH